MNLKLGMVSVWFALSMYVLPCLSQVAADQQQELASHIQKAQQFLREKQPELAIPELQAAVALDPNNAETQGNLGVLLFFQGTFSDAIPHFRAALAQQPSLAKIQGLLGIAELRTSDVSDARKDLQTSFPNIPDRKFKTQAGLELVGIYTQSSDLEDAATVIAELRKTDPANPEVLYAAYRTYSDLSSESMLALALAAPDSAQMHQLLAHEEIKEGNTNGAIVQFRKAMAIDPHLPDIHYELAELLNSSTTASIKNDAEKEYYAALLANPLNEKAECRLGEIDAKRGNATKAVEEFSKAVELRPADADAKVDLAKELMVLEQPDKALALLEEAIQLEPTNETAHYRLAMIYRTKKRTEDYKHELQVYQELKDAKQKLRATYKELLIQPSEISSDEQNEK